MDTSPRARRTGRGAALVAVVFGVVTLLAGGRILLGLGEAGYDVLRPVLAFNTAMGAAYVAAGVGLWRGARWGRIAAVAIALANVGVLLALVLRRAGGGAVAVETMRAMTLRTVVWPAIGVVVLAAARAERGARRAA